MPENKQPTEIQRQLQNLLLYPREDLDIELKNWLDLSEGKAKANLAQALLALANHGGGYIILGHTKNNNEWIPDENRPENLGYYSQDVINGIVQRYADPSYHCEVHHVTHPERGDSFPIIKVPGGHKVPIRAIRPGPDGAHVHQNTYYIRRPGPCSEPPRTGREWDELISRCIRSSREDLLDRMRDIFLGIGNVPDRLSPEEQQKANLENWIQKAKEQWEALLKKRLPHESPSRYANGIWNVAYSLTGDFQIPSLKEFKEILRKAKGHETGWPLWVVIDREDMKPYVNNGFIECWFTQVDDSAAYSDFWRASPEGKMFLLKGYYEDASEKVEPGTVFEVTTPIWQVGECLSHAERLANLFGNPTSSILIRFTWEGLSGRTLSSSPNLWVYRKLTSQQETVVSEIQVQADQIVAALPEVVKTITKPLYEVFDFFDPSIETIDAELKRMRGRR